MKYFTKQWYENCGKTHYHFLLQVDDQAAVFSEDYFTNLYNSRLEEHIASEKEMAEMDPEFGINYMIDYYKSIPDFEFNEEEYRAKVSIEKVPFDLEKAKEIFLVRYGWEMQIAQDIVSDVPNLNIADIRVLALRVTTLENYQKIKSYSENMKKQIEKVMNDYQIYYRTIEASLPQEIKDLNMHDSLITNCGFEGNDLWMDIGPYGNFTTIDKLIFKNAHITEGDLNLKDFTWIYDEIYIADNHYELHVLLIDRTYEMGLKEITLTMDGVLLQYPSN